MIDLEHAFNNMRMSLMVKISKMTFCAVDVPAMVTFYNAVLDADFTPLADNPPGFHQGAIAGIPTLLCPNSIAQVDARQNRQQFDFLVDDIEKTMQAVLGSGGRINEPITNQNGMLVGSAYDPDGNSLVFIQSSD